MTRIGVTGKLTGLRGRLQLVESHDAPFRLRDDLLRHDDHIGVLEPAQSRRCVREQSGELVALLDLRDALECEDPDLGAHGRPVTRRPACAL